jgi:hypothetical protein
VSEQGWCFLPHLRSYLLWKLHLLLLWWDLCLVMDLLLQRLQLRLLLHLMPDQDLERKRGRGLKVSQVWKPGSAQQGS